MWVALNWIFRDQSAGCCEQCEMSFTIIHGTWANKMGVRATIVSNSITSLLQLILTVVTLPLCRIDCLLTSMWCFLQPSKLNFIEFISLFFIVSMNSPIQFHWYCQITVIIIIIIMIFCTQPAHCDHYLIWNWEMWNNIPHCCCFYS
jgi:hypothetical protein